MATEVDSDELQIPINGGASRRREETATTRGFGGARDLGTLIVIYIGKVGLTVFKLRAPRRTGQTVMWAPVFFFFLFLINSGDCQAGSWSRQVGWDLHCVLPIMTLLIIFIT